MSQISLSGFADFSSAVPWGLWVALYIWLVGISAGSFFLTSWGNLRGNPQLKKITAIATALSIATLLTGLLSIQIDLGHIERFYKLFTSPHFTSVMAWMVWLYGAYFIILAASLRWIKKEIPRKFLLLASVFSISIIFIESLLFALPPGRHWHSVIFPAHFLVSSLVSGIAALMFITGLIWVGDGKKELLRGLSNVALPLIALNLGIEIMEMVSLGGTRHMESWVLLSGNVIVIALLLGHNTVTMTLAGLIEVIDVFLSKYNSLISAQLVEPFKGFGAAYTEPRMIFSYTPTGFEWGVAAAVVFLAAALFWFLHKILPAVIGRAE